MSEDTGQQQRYCGNCGAEVRPGMAFCFSCGTPLTAGAQEPGPSHPEPTSSEEPSPFDKLMTWLRQAADRLGGSFSGLSTDGARRLPTRAVGWFRDLPSFPKLVIVGLVLLALLIPLSPVAAIICALLLGVSIIALIIRVVQRRSVKSWGIVAVASVVLMFTFGATSDALYGNGFTGSGSQTIEPLPGVSAKAPDGWVISSDSNQSGRIIGNTGEVVKIFPVGKEGKEDAPSIWLRKAYKGECNSQPIEVTSSPELAAPSPALGGYDNFLQASGSMDHGRAVVDGHAAPWNLRYESVALPWISSDLTMASPYPDYLAGVILSICVQGTQLVADYNAPNPSLSGISQYKKDPGIPPTADRNAAVPEAREEVHREIRQGYEEHFGAMKQFLESIDTGGWFGRTDISGIPPTLEGHDGVLDDPFQGELLDATAYADPSDAGSPE